LADDATEAATPGLPKHDLAGDDEPTFRMLVVEVLEEFVCRAHQRMIDA
jgi:hypothetical protein